MEKNTLSVRDALKYSRHDHVNDLQLLLMYLDMGMPDKARECILQATDRMQQEAVLQKLGMPMTEEWLTTLEWRHPSFLKTLRCQIDTSSPIQVDRELVSFLEELFETIEDGLDPFSEYGVTIDVEADASAWSIRLVFNNLQAEALELPRTPHTVNVNIQKENDDWTCVLSGQLGGN